MRLKITSQKTNLLVLGFFLISSLAFGQRENAKWKLQLALGPNHGFSSGFAEGVYGKRLNFPTVNVGLQHFFTGQLGAKLDIGFNRLSQGPNLPEFKTNYTRINAQIVYDPTYYINFLPERVRILVHAGPGISFTAPLGTLKENNLTFLNVMAGGELHYGLSETLSIYGGGAFVFGLSGKDLSTLDQAGLGAFNGTLMYATIGLSVSLSGCYYCN
jgi:hypothetical protein